MQEGQPPAWSSYVKVDDADETAEKVKDAGGNVVVGPFDLPTSRAGWRSARTPSGAFFWIRQQRGHKGAELVNEVGAWTWNNLVTRDLDKAKGFYGEVFGWKATHSEGAPEHIFNWQVEGQRWPEGLGGADADRPDDVPAEVPPHWQVYFLVQDTRGRSS